MRLTRWTDNHEVKSRGSCCGLLRDQPVHGAKIFNRNAGTYSCLPNQTVWTNVFARCGATKWQRWGQREEATTASLLQAGCNTGRYFHITPTKHNYGRNKFASITKQPELHNWAGGGRWSPPTQQARPVPSLQTALPYLVKGGAQQNKFRSSLLSRYERFTKEITPPPLHVLQQCICKCRSPMQFHILHPPIKTFTQTHWMDPRHLYELRNLTIFSPHYVQTWNWICMLGCEVALYATAIQNISIRTADFHFDSVLPTSEFRLFTRAYEKHRRRKI